MKVQTYPEDYSCILEPQANSGGLFIGNLEAAQSTRTLSKHSIKAILTAAKGVSLNHPKHLVPETMHVPAEDHDGFDISAHLNRAADFIHNSLQNTNIMVHCLAGVSRSVSLVLAYLIKYRGMSYEQAYSLVKAKRKIIHPNDGFIRQLKHFALQICSKGRDNTPNIQPHRYASPQRFNHKDSHYRSIQHDEPRKSRSSLSPSRYPSLYRRYQMNNDDRLKQNWRQYSISTNFAQSSLNFQEAGINRQICSQRQNVQARIKSISSAGLTRPSNYLKATNNINTSDIDRRIEEIRMKYQDFSKGPWPPFNRLAAENSNKRQHGRLEQSKKRGYNYLSQLQQTTGRFNNSNYIYTQA